MSQEKQVGLEKHVTSPRTLPPEGLEVTIPEGKAFTRIHLDLAHDGITLATVGAAHAARVPGNRQKVTLKPSKDGVTLAVVGAASAVKR